MTKTWKLTLACTRAEAETFAGDPPHLAQFEPPPVFMTSEPDERRPDAWQLDVYTEGHPPQALIEAVLATAPSAGGGYALVEVEEEDWVTLSQAGLEPVVAGRFFVHTAADAALCPDDAIGLQIEAGLAFGTGQHATTTGCLFEIDAIDKPPTNALDLGTGTAILALAIKKRWPGARVAASDIDPIAIKVSRENLAVNGVSESELPLFVADGLGDAELSGRAPYDLIVANILAGPLVEMAPAVADALAPGGTLVLAGLLTSQADDVEAAYQARGLEPRSRRPVGDWPTLRLSKP